MKILGDIVFGVGTVIQAVADGRRAAAAIHAQLSTAVLPQSDPVRSAGC